MVELMRNSSSRKSGSLPFISEIVFFLLKISLKGGIWPFWPMIGSIVLVCGKREPNSLFGSLEREESRGEESRGEWLFSTLFGCFKINKGEGSN